MIQFYPQKILEFSWKFSNKNFKPEIYENSKPEIYENFKPKIHDNSKPEIHEKSDSNQKTSIFPQDK